MGVEFESGARARDRAARRRRRGGDGGARGEGRRVHRHARLRRLPHGVLRGSRRQLADPAPEVRGLMARAEALERYRSLPVPGTDDEPWRFTDLRGFDPETFSAAARRSRGPSRCSSSTSPGSRTWARAGSRSSVRPRASSSSCSSEDHPRLHELVGWDEKFAAHNAAAWQAGLLVRVPKGVVVEQPLYVRVANAVEDGSLFWRLLVEVEESASLTLIEEYASARPDLRGYSNAVAELFVGRTRSSSTCRSRTSRARRGTSPRTTRASTATPSSTGSPAASARRRARCGSRTTSPARARPRA